MKRLFIPLPEVLPAALSDCPETSQAAVAEADEIWLSLPASRVLLTQLTLSRRALRQLNGALGNALEDQLMLDPAQVHIALGKPGGEQQDVHPAAVIEAAWLEQALALCRQRGIEPVGATPEALLWDAAPGQWSMRWHGHAGFVRSGPGAGFALDDGDAETPPLALRLALAEARRLNASPAAIMLETEVAVNAASWSRQLECPLQLQPLHPDMHAPVINLLQGPYASRRRGSSDWLGKLINSQSIGQFRLAGGLVAAALAVHVLGTLADWARLSWENRRLRAEMHQVFQATFPQTQAIVDPTLQMQRQLADLRRARGYAEAGDFLHAISAAGDLLGGVQGLSYENHRLTLLQPRATDLAGLRNTLAAQGYQMETAGEPGRQSITLSEMK